MTQQPSGSVRTTCSLRLRWDSVWLHVLIHWLFPRYAAIREGRAPGAADRHHSGRSETQPAALLLPRLPRCRCLAAAGCWGANGHCHAGHAVKLPSQVGIFVTIPYVDE